MLRISGALRTMERWAKETISVRGDLRNLARQLRSLPAGSWPNFQLALEGINKRLEALDRVQGMKNYQKHILRDLHEISSRTEEAGRVIFKVKKID